MRTMPCIHTFKAVSSLMFVQSRAPSGAAGEEGKGMHPQPAETPGMRSICLKFYSHVRCVHCSTRLELQIKSSRRSSRGALPWGKAGFNSVTLVPFSLESWRHCTPCFIGL